MAIKIYSRLVDGYPNPIKKLINEVSLRQVEGESYLLLDNQHALPNEVLSLLMVDEVFENRDTRGDIYDTCMNIQILLEEIQSDEAFMYDVRNSQQVTTYTQGVSEIWGQVEQVYYKGGLEYFEGDGDYLYEVSCFLRPYFIDRANKACS